MSQVILELIFMSPYKHDFVSRFINELFVESFPLNALHSIYSYMSF